MPQRTRRAWTWIGRHEFGSFVVLLVASGALLVFVALVALIRRESIRSIDEDVLLAINRQTTGSSWMEEIGRDLTALGGVAVLTLLTLGVLGFLALHRMWRTGLLVAVAVGGGLLLSNTLKYVIDRPRPDLAVHGSHVVTPSFPSGHSMMSMVAYLTLAALLARLQPNPVVKAYLIVCAILVSVLVGLSRVALAVHWFTDVVAGFSLGAAWAMCCWLVMRRLQHHGRVEQKLDRPAVANS